MASTSPSPRKRPTAFVNQLAMAMELPFILIGGIVIGGGLGWFLDRHFLTSPALTLLGGALGFGGGMWDILKRLSRAEKNQGKDDAGG